MATPGGLDFGEMKFDLDSKEISESIFTESTFWRSMLFSLGGIKFSLVGGRKGSALIPKANLGPSSIFVVFPGSFKYRGIRNC